jgi:DNA polymerase-1
LQSQLDIYNEVWHPQLFALFEAERNGLYLDVNLCDKAISEYQEEIRIPRIELRRWVGREFNHKSWKQIQDVIYREKGFPVPPIQGSASAIKRVFPGELPTSAVALDWIVDNCPDTGALKHINKLKKADRDIQRLKTFPEQRDVFGRVHYQLKPSTSTGRLAASNIPIQQIPKFGILRYAFRAEPGYKLIVADYSQLEMRVLAHFLVKLFDSYELANDLVSGDLHTLTAEKLGVIRNVAKAINFSINYGKSKFGLSAQLGITVEHAADLLRDYHSTYPGIRRFHTFCESFALRTGYIETIIGRRRLIPELQQTENRGLYGIGYRKAINTPIQGSAADIVVHAMIACYTDRRLRELKSEFCCQVHDELIFRVPENNAYQATEIVKELMQNAYKLETELPVNAAFGDSWGDAK